MRNFDRPARRHRPRGGGGALTGAAADGSTFTARLPLGTPYAGEPDAAAFADVGARPGRRGACCWSARAGSPSPGWRATRRSSPRSGSGTCRAAPRPAGRASSASPGAATTRRARPTRPPPTTPPGSSAACRAARWSSPAATTRRSTRCWPTPGCAGSSVAGPWLAVPDPRRAVLEQAVADALSVADRGPQRLSARSYARLVGTSAALVIDVRGLVKRFGPVRALDGLDLAVRRGEVHGFLGPNGAGKSTTLRALLGLLRSDGGTASVFGLDPWRDGVAIHRRLAYVPGDVALWPNLSGGETDRPAAADARRRPPRGAPRGAPGALRPRPHHERGRAYSKGNRQKVALVAALAADVDLLVLDEPTSGLDPLMEQVFADCVAERVAAGTTVLLSSHILSEVERLADRVTIIREGRTVESGTPRRAAAPAAQPGPARRSPGPVPDLAGAAGRPRPRRRGRAGSAAPSSRTPCPPCWPPSPARGSPRSPAPRPRSRSCSSTPTARPPGRHRSPAREPVRRHRGPGPDGAAPRPGAARRLGAAC